MAQGRDTVTNTYKKIGYGSARGLSDAEVARSRAEHGDNSLSRGKRKSFLRQFVSNLGDPVIKILIGALIINVIFTFRNADWFETAGIAISVLLATLISTASEYGSAAAFERLDAECGKQRCRVRRNGVVCEVDIREVVVGDIALVGAGEQISADGALISGAIACDQSAMTGESKEAYKSPRRMGQGEDMTPSSSYYCLRGCTVLSGEGEIEVASVGDKTFLGGISREIQTETRESPLKIRLGKLAKQISAVGYVAAVLVALVYLFNTFFVDSAFDVAVIKYKLTSFDFLFANLFHALTLGLTVIVVAVPEGLPMMIAVVLSSNIKKMVKDNVLVRKPVGIESAGSMNILFTDKTGTLTEGKLSVGQIFLGDGREIDGIGRLAKTAVYGDFLLSAVGNTTSAAGLSHGKRTAVGGNSTDRAIMNFVIGREKKLPEFEAVKNIPFDSEKKFSAALVTQGKRRRLFVKGAPERLMPYVRSCVGENGERMPFSCSRFQQLCSTLTSSGKRVLMIAECESDYMGARFERGEFGDLRLLCLITLEDRIRREAARSVTSLRGAGIHVVMITGDNKDTARYIASKCGILGGGVDVVLSGGELAHLSDSQLKELLPRLAVVARALPADKSRLVRISQELELVTGMTGDGVNDAPALKRADVGFAMGSGTQVAKDAGDVIILDNDLASIVKAVLYGRNIFKSIRKFITLQLMMNFCAVGVSMICPFLGYEAPVTVVQMLWINIIMDTLGGLAFAGEPALESCMEEKPKRRDEPILNGYMIYQIVFGGGFTVALCIAFLKVPEILSRFRVSGDNIYLLTAFFALFIFASVFNCFCARTDRIKLLANITKNRAFIGIMAAVLIIQILFVYLGGAVLRTAPLLAQELMTTFLLALLVFPADLLRKLLWRAIFGKKGY
ncbi:MAG: calcium-translocating P-type ATPase, PMCA-type [Clostridia bacterium]|nr:calcium-translocating P-type ATPase, PMCA-type [Clostridia bacterium]